MKKFSHILLFFIIANSVFSQYWTKESYKTDFFSSNKIGAMIDIPLRNQELHDDILYIPLILQAKFVFPLSKKPRYFFPSLNLLPQINPAISRFEKTIISREMEIGLNLEFQLNIRILKNTAIYGALGLGPHYVSTNTKRQRPGFIFSDNIITGLRQKINDKIELNLHYKFRHISNANLKLPNWGINNYLIGIGLVTRM